MDIFHDVKRNGTDQPISDTQNSIKEGKNTCIDVIVEDLDSKKLKDQLDNSTGLKRYPYADNSWMGIGFNTKKPLLDNRYSDNNIVTHNNLSHNCYAIKDWEHANKKFKFLNNNIDIIFLDEIQFMHTSKTLENVEIMLNKGIDVICAGLDQDSRGKPWETSSMLLGLSDKITKIYGFCNVCGLEATKTYRKTKGGGRTKVGSADTYEPRCLKHWQPR